MFIVTINNREYKTNSILRLTNAMKRGKKFTNRTIIFK